jgi:hypothetical protein
MDSETLMTLKSIRMMLDGHNTILSTPSSLKDEVLISGMIFQNNVAKRSLDVILKAYINQDATGPVN